MHIKRQEYLNKLISYKDKDIVKIITGIRRSGKSVLLFELYYDYLIKIGIDDGHIIRINLETQKNAPLRNAEKLYESVISRVTDGGRYYIFIDEIQLVENFEDVINGLRVDVNSDVYITGSNSKLLSKDINTKMRGRGVEIKVFPLSFSEFYGFYGGDRRKCFNDYMYYGGLPYLLSETDGRNKAEYLKMICDTVIGKDIVERHGIRREGVFGAVVEFLCSNIGSYVSANKIAAVLSSNGYKTTAETVGEYLEYVCDAFLFYKAQRFDIKGKEYLKTLNKYYIADLGIRNSKLNFRQMEITHALENIVYLDLLRRGYMVDIGVNASKEIDFVARSDKDLYYIQAAYTVADSEKLEQEISSFYRLDDGYKKIVVTMDDDPFTSLKNGYKKINALDFLLDDSALEKI